MRLKHHKFLGMAGLALVMVLCIAQTAPKVEAQDGLDQAMKSFVDALKAKNPKGVLASFSRTTPWHYVTYSVVNDELISRTAVTFAEMEKDFRTKKNWYDSFLDPDDQIVKLHDKITHVKWTRNGTTFNSISDTYARLYITFRKEGDSWVIAEIGETLS